MKFDGEFSLAASPNEMWEFMLDPENMGKVIPNCQNIDVIDEDNYTAEIGVSVSKISVTFDAQAEIIEKRPNENLKFQLSGSARDGDSRMESNVEINLTEAEDGTTDVEWVNEVEVTGRIMNMGSRIVRSVGMRQTNKTISNVQDELGVPERAQEEESGGLLS